MNTPPISHPLICTRCATKGRTCCELSNGDEEFCFPLSDAERTTILDAGAGQENCFVPMPNTPDFVTQLTHLLPEYDVKTTFPRQGTHWRLATTAQGQCIFLQGTGCALERNLRPAYCKLFPLWPLPNHLTWFAAEECLANTECASLDELLKAMGTTRSEIYELFTGMCLALGLQAR